MMRTSEGIFYVTFSILLICENVKLECFVLNNWKPTIPPKPQTLQVLHQISPHVLFDICNLTVLNMKYN